MRRRTGVECEDGHTVGGYYDGMLPQAQERRKGLSIDKNISQNKHHITTVKSD